MPASPPHANAADPRTAAPPRVPLLPVLLVLTVSVSLHVVPQWLKAWIDPAWTMAALMLLDALIIAVLVRSQGALRTVLLLAGLLALVVLTRQQSFVALPSLVMYVALTSVFGLWLRAGAEPLIARIARFSYPADMSPTFERYLRRLTAAWTLLFAVLGCITVVLALVAPFAWWSLFANVLSWAVMAAMFTGEWLMRRLLLPHLPAHTPLQTIGSTIVFAAGGGWSAVPPRTAVAQGADAQP